MKFQPVTSGNIAEVGHDPATNTLAVRFKGKGGTLSEYHYDHVTPDEHHRMMTAPSVGEHFHAFIKPHHPHRKV